MPHDRLASALRALLAGSPLACEGHRNLTAETKRELSALAIELGADDCQALYHAVVYMTRCA